VLQKKKKNKYPKYAVSNKRLRTTGVDACHTILEKICEHLVAQNNVGLINYFNINVIKLFISFMVFAITNNCGDGVTVVPMCNFLCVPLKFLLKCMPNMTALTQ
jgi:hypothetical protein